MSERKGTKALELWCKRLVKDCPEVQIENMTTSWRNGIAFCALVHHFRPDLIDMSKLKPENIYENNQLAFSIAEKQLGIPSLLDPEDMVANEVPDRLSILTYLSQFYQRLGQSVNTKAVEGESRESAPPSVSPGKAPIQFGKTGLDKCDACELPVYLAQRLIVSHKLYHRRCFRCSKCSGQMNANNYELTKGSEFICDSCKNEKSLTKFLNNNDQMGMLAFTDELPESNPGGLVEETVSPKRRSRPNSILEKMSIFENKDCMEKFENLSLKGSPDSVKNTSTAATANIYNDHSNSMVSRNSTGDHSLLSTDNVDSSIDLPKSTQEKSYKSSIDKFNFLQTQLSGDSQIEFGLEKNLFESEHKKDPLSDTQKHKDPLSDTDKHTDTEKFRQVKEESNVTDDKRIANNVTPDANFQTKPTEQEELNISVPVPPRKKKLVNSPAKSRNESREGDSSKAANVEYPDDLNPFGDDDETEETQYIAPEKKESTNPFGSSDEEDDVVPPIASPPNITVSQDTTPARRLIAVNPFWSDGEEPSSDDDESLNQSPKKPYESALATSTPNLPMGTPRRRKAPAPPPPTLQVPNPPPATSSDDVSMSSLSSHNSTIPDHKSLGPVTPRSTKRAAPTPPDSRSISSSMDHGVDSIGNRSHTSDGSVPRTKRPAPGLPLPERRSVKLQMSPEQLQLQLDMLETQQLGLERQGVIIETMIRDKCEGDAACTEPVPQEEVEDLVIQLCELVNEKNDLFRKQTELMYIRRQQRLEQEQADIEHEIRVIQSRPAVNRIDADKAREEQLVSRLVRVVRMRDELVQQIDAERRRERQEDLAIAASIASKRAQRNSESNSSSLKSDVAAVPKKSKVKDKVKKQLKKAKHTFISKKKDEYGDHKEHSEKGKKHK